MKLTDLKEEILSGQPVAWGNSKLGLPLIYGKKHKAWYISAEGLFSDDWHVVQLKEAPDYVREYVERVQTGDTITRDELTEYMRKALGHAARSDSN